MRSMLWGLMLLSFATGATDAPNLVLNGDFAQSTGGVPDHWSASGDKSSVTQTLTVARDGDKPYAQLTCTRCEKSNPASYAMLAQIGGANLVRGKLYEFSCRVRAEGLASRSVSVALSDTKEWSNAGLSSQLAAGATWKSYSRIFRATRDIGPTGRLQIWFAEPGTLCIADVRILERAQEEAEFTAVVPPGDGKNLVRNGSFELGRTGWSSLGLGAGWGNLNYMHGSAGDSGWPFDSGAHFLSIPLGGTSTPVLYFDYYEPVVRRELRPLAASVGWIKLEKGAKYTLSCQMRATADDTPALIGVRGQDPAGSPRDHLQTVTLSREWKPCTFTFTANEHYCFVLAGPALQQEKDVTVSIDRVQLEKGLQATEFQPWKNVDLMLKALQGQIRVQNQGTCLGILGFNGGTENERRTVKFVVTDFEDKVVPLHEVSLSIRPAGTSCTNLVIPPEWRGYYRIRSFEAGSAVPFGDLCVAIVPKRTADDSVCGINHAFATNGLINLAALAGVTWYRDWSLKWQHIEPKPGEWHWDVGDAQIDRVLNERARVLPLLPPFPSADWSSEAPDGLPTKGYPGVRLKTAWGPKNPADLSNFVGKSVEHYKDRLHTFEFLNEPIYTDYALPADHANIYKGRKYTYSDYVALLQTASAAMRKADPDCKVIGGIGSGPRDGTKEVITAGILKHIDIFNLHMYPGTREPETFAGDMDALLAQMDAAGGRKPIWITEFSYYGTDTLPRTPFVPSNNNWSEERLLENEKQCADYTVRFFLTMLSHGVERIFIHSGASGQVNAPSLECALFDYGGAPRKLFPALAVLTALLGPAPASAGWRDFNKSGVYGAAFKTAQGCVVALWREDGAEPKKIAVPGADEGKWTDAMGRTLAGPPEALSTSPVYLTGPADKAKQWLEAAR